MEVVEQYVRVTLFFFLHIFRNFLNELLGVKRL